MKYTIFLVLLLIPIFTGCSKVESIDESTDQLQKGKIVNNYNYVVDHNKKPLNKRTINLRPHKELVEFYQNAPASSIWTYGSGSTPLIVRAKVGDQLTFNVENDLSQDTTVHWHGIRVPNSEDGVPGVTQDPIQPGDDYQYTYTVWDPGTYRFHPHINTAEQIAKGLYGILIVEEENQPFEYDKEWVWALKDYRFNRNGTLNQQFNIPMDYRMAGRLGNIMTVNNEISPTYIGNPGETILLRLANTSNARTYNLDLRDFNATVVQSDGGNIKKTYKPNILQIGAGERYSILLTLPERPQTLMLIDSYFPSRPNLIARISVEENESGEVTKQNDLSNSTYEGDSSVPDWRTNEGSTPDYVIDLGGTNVSGGDKMFPGRQSAWTIEDGVFPSSLEEIQHVNPILTMKQGRKYIVRLQNNSGRDHPMHLHGDFFQVLEVNGRKRPYAGWKDTINVPAKSYTDIALIPTNPGTWMFHCHIVEHAEFGMMATIKID